MSRRWRRPHVVRLSLDVDDVRDMVEWIDEATAYIIELAPIGGDARTMSHLSTLSIIRRTLLPRRAATP